jgi:hypothetical protein
MSQGAFAIIYGRYLKYYIKDPEVSLRIIVRNHHLHSSICNTNDNLFDMFIIWVLNECIDNQKVILNLPLKSPQIKQNMP